MIKFTKKMFSLFPVIAMVLLLGGAVTTVYAAPQGDAEKPLAEEEECISGSCGPELTWSYSPENHTLTISGTGKMNDYSGSKPSPWYKAGLDFDVEKIIVSEGVTSIGKYAFSDFISVEKVSLPSSLVSIEKGAFSWCDMLNDPVLPEGLLSIGDYAFEWCSNIQSICLPASLTSIGIKVFGDSSLKTIEVAENSESFSAESGILYNKDKTEVVYAAPALSGKVTVSSGVKSIRQWAFSDSSDLSEIVLPSGLEKIEKHAFEYCFDLIKISLPDGLKEIGNFAFNGCFRLTEIKIPASVTDIGSNIIMACTVLEKVEVDKDNKNYSAKGVILYDKKKTKILAAPASLKGSLTLLESVTEIACSAFEKCEDITSVRMPSGLTKIGREAFLDCSGLTKVIMSPKVTVIEDSAFDCCSSLEVLRMQGDAPELTGENRLGSVPTDYMVVYYPSGASGYETDSWYDYTCESYIPETGVTLDKTSFTLYTGSSKTLKAEVTPSEAFFKTVTWKSSNSKIASVSGKGVVKGLIPGKVTITATTDNGKKAQCEVTVKLAAPKLEKVTSAGYNTVKVTWKKVTGASGYYVYRKTADGWKRLTTITSGSTVSYKDSGLTCGKKYTYTVKAYRKSGDSTIKSGYDKNGISGKPVPATPSLKSLEKASGTSLKLTWGKVSGASGYIVYRKTGNGKWKKIKTISGGSTVAYTNTGLKKGTKYTYTVKAYRVVNETKVYSGYDKKGLAKTLK